MRFEVLPQQVHRKFDVVYRIVDHALDSVPTPNNPAYTSLCFNEVQLEFSASGLADHVWGYCPKQSWQKTEAEPPAASPGELRITPMSELVPGVSVSVSKTRLPVHYNGHSRWLCLGDPSRDVRQGFCVQVAPNLIVVGDPSHIFALWIRITRFEP